MQRREFLGTVAGGVGLTLAGCVAPVGDATFSEGFEDGLGDWETTAAIGPEVDLADFDWEIAVSDEQAAEGANSLRVRNEGDHDDGTCWATHEVPVEPGRAYVARVEAQFWSDSESFNSIRDAVMRLGPDRPEAEADFPDPGLSTTALGVTPYGGLREPLWLEPGFRSYGFEWTTPELATDTLYLSLGTSVVWESTVTHYVDAVRVTLRAR